MDIDIKKRFEVLWARYFPGAERPLAFYYTDEDPRDSADEPRSTPRCVIAGLKGVRKGQQLVIDASLEMCRGGLRFLGFKAELRPEFAYFLSCGIPGKLEGERYKKSPDVVREVMKSLPPFEAPARFAVFKRWEDLQNGDQPEVFIFFATPDVLSGLFALANFDEVDLNGVITPFGAGCATIVHYPYLEGRSDHPRAVIGMFDISARPFVSPGELTFAVPMNKFLTMLDNMEESFLITKSWEKIRERMRAGRDTA